jgi:uncharacterized protein (DUF983 family)
MNLFSGECPNCGSGIPWHRIGKSFRCKGCNDHLRAATGKAILVAIVVAMPFEAFALYFLGATMVGLLVKGAVGLAVLAWAIAKFSDLRVRESGD